jgi:hypothetical protein
MQVRLLSPPPFLLAAAFLTRVNRMNGVGTGGVSDRVTRTATRLFRTLQLVDVMAFQVFVKLGFTA